MKSRMNNRDKRGRWQKGKSANPNGRPRKPKALTELLRKMLAAQRADGRTRMEAILDKMLSMAEEGHVDAAKYICDRLEGRPAQALELTGDKEKPLRITYVDGNKEA